jgi:hypothetical protein
VQALVAKLMASTDQESIRVVLPKKALASASRSSGVVVRRAGPPDAK